MKTKLKEINKLANEIMHEIDGLLDGDKPERIIFTKARKIAKLSEN